MARAHEGVVVSPNWWKSDRSVVAVERFTSNRLRSLRGFTTGIEFVPADQTAQPHFTAAQEAEEQQQNCLLVRQRGLGFGPPPELLVDSLQRVGGAQRLPLRGWE